MAKEKSERKRDEVQAADTPRRVRQQKVLAIGSSSTWNQDELDLFRVAVQGDVDVREMIPERFFDFGAVTNYGAGTSPLVFRS